MRETDAKLDNTMHLPPRERALSADALFQMLRQGAVQAAPAGPPPTADPALVKNLVEMGFPEARSTKALLLNGNDLNAAMEWLINHAEDPDVDVPLTQHEL